MQKHLTRVLGAVVVLGLFAASPAHAQAFGSGLTPGTPGARANAMGGTFIAIADDATASISNPGGLMSLTRPQVYLELSSAAVGEGFSFENFEPTVQRATSLGFVGASAPLGRVTVGGTYHQFFNLDSPFSFSDGPDDQFKITGSSYGATLATSFDRLRVGATFLAQKLNFNIGGDEDSDSGTAVVLGGLYNVSDMVTIGVSGTRGSEATAINRIGGGIALRPSSRLLASLDVVRIGSDFNATEVHAGAEYAIPVGMNQLFLRAGAFGGSNEFDTADSGGSVGAGMTVGQRLQIDLAYSSLGKRFVASAAARF